MSTTLVFRAEGNVSRATELSSYPKGMYEENKIHCAYKVGYTRGRTRQAQGAAAQARKNVLDREHCGHWHAGVMPAKGVQPMRVGSGD